MSKSVDKRHALVTGGAGFIGSHLVDRLLDEGWRVTVVDNFDPFYDPAIKERNVAAHLENERYALHRLDIRDLDGLRRNLADAYDVIVHLAAKAGVRPSIQDPVTYQEVNVVVSLTRFGGHKRLVSERCPSRRFKHAANASTIPT